MKLVFSYFAFWLGYVESGLFELVGLCLLWLLVVWFSMIELVWFMRVLDNFGLFGYAESGPDKFGLFG